MLPLAVIASFLTGLFDGKVRFRRTSAPLFTRKKLLGGAFFVLSAAAAALALVVGPYVAWVRVVNVVLLAAGVLCQRHPRADGQRSSALGLPGIKKPSCQGGPGAARLSM